MAYEDGQVAVIGRQGQSELDLPVEPKGEVGPDYDGRDNGRGLAGALAEKYPACLVTVALREQDGADDIWMRVCCGGQQVEFQGSDSAIDEQIANVSGLVQTGLPVEVIAEQLRAGYPDPGFTVSGGGGQSDR